jgi:hypothetical protein
VKPAARRPSSTPSRERDDQDADRAVASAREGKRYGPPDEPRYNFEIGKGEQRQSFDVWRSELSECPELHRIVTALQRLVDEQVKDEIIL